MFPFLFAIVLVASASIFLAGTLALIRSPRKRLNRSFFIFSIILASWGLFNFLGSNLIDSYWTDVFVRLDYFFASLLVWSLVYFLSTYNQQDRFSLLVTSRSVMTAIFVYQLFLGLLIIFGYVVDVEVTNNGLLIEEERAYFLYGINLLASIAAAFTMFYRAFHHSKLRQRSELSFILAGTTIAIILNFLSNIVFPSIFDSRQVIQSLNIFGYIGLVLFAITIYLSISIKRLFDIRMVIARSLGYIFTTILLALSYGLISVGLTRLASSDNQTIDLLIQVFIVTAAAISYAPLKKRLDKATNRIFYRDAYDPQHLVDGLNDLLVSTLDLKVLMKGATELIASNMKLTFAQFGLFDIHGANHDFMTFGGGPEGDERALALVRAHKSGVMLAEEYDIEDINRQMLDDFEAGAVLKLLLPKQTGLGGYLIFGTKLSGNSYTNQDIKTFETLSKELTVATQNALQYRQIQTFNQTLEKKIDDATNQLKRSNEKLKALDEAKDDFVSMASHQLRTPLTSVKGYLSMVLEGDAGELNEQQRSMLDQAFTSSQRMTYLIADLLNLSRLKTGKFVIDNNPTNLVKVITQELSQVEATAEARKLTIAYEEPAVFPTMMLDETKIRQVIMNFVDNAIYYTPGGGEITVKLEELDKSIEFTVHDTGIGVPAADQHNLFSKFYRAANAKQARPDGTGLGLFMARKVIIAQGGATIFRSQVGKGSTFGFSFPKTLATNEPARKT